ncbi:hypothetical protein QQX98_007376 [Neonectria punicea]|uniref:BZIP domain-containing protein n=1 Tax=Neonectria punicea TaxID=979145 RepID=A0ABR1GYH1_9HYPO
MSPPIEPQSRNAAEPSKRERGRIAQREYRKRHASRFQSLQEENQRLKNAILKISRAASSGERRGKQLEEAILEAAVTAELDETEQKRLEEASPLQDSVEDSLIRHPSLLEMPSEQWISQNQTETSIESLSLDNTSLLMLSQQIWLDADRVVRIYDAPSDVVAFLGDGLFTIAGCLYWACTYYAVSLWKKTKGLETPAPSDKNRLDRMFNHSKHLTDRDFLLSLAQARLEFRKKGYVERMYVQDFYKDNDAIAEVHEKIKEEYAEKNEAIQWWRKPQEVETYMRQHLTAEELVQLQDIVEGRGSETALKAFAPLFETLASNFVCFGDGPRWNVVHVSMTLGAWLGSRRHN